MAQTDDHRDDPVVDAVEHPADGTPPYRYRAALAAEIEARWQDRWEAEGTFEAPNPAGPLADPERLAGRPKLFLLDMFPYPSGAGLHVGHPLGYIGTDVFGRYRRMKGDNVLHALGYDAFGLPAEQYAIETGTHPGVRTEENVATIRRQLRRLGLAHDPRRSVATTDESYYRWTQWIFLQIFNSWYDPERDRARPIAELVAELESGERADAGRPSVGGAGRGRAPPDRRRPSPGLPRRGAGELVPGPRHGAGQRGGHRRRAQRPRQLPGVPAQHAPVDDADHRVRRSPHRRPGPPRLARVDQDDAAQLDRAVRRRDHPVRLARGADRGLHDPARHVLRRHLHGARTGAPAGGRAHHGGVAGGHPPAWTGGHATPAEAIGSYRDQAAAKTDLARQAEDRDKTGVFTGSFATNPATGAPIPVFVADYVLMGYGTGAIMAVPGQDERDWEFAESFDLPIVRTVEPPGDWDGQAYLGDGPAINSANDSLDLNGLDVADGQAGDDRLAGGERPGRRAPPPTACGTGCSAGSATGASRSRSSTTRPACRSACPSRCCP